MTFTPAYGFSDVLLRPRLSDVKSRSEIPLTVKLPRGYEVLSPILAANMVDCQSYGMLEKCVEIGSMVLFHRFDREPAEMLQKWGDLKSFAYDFLELKYNLPIGISVGVKDSDKQTIDSALKQNCKVFCVDVAHGHSDLCVNMTAWLRKQCPDALIVSGNVCTYDGTYNLLEAGADIIKVGIGPGFSCTTRLQAGAGVPQMTALEGCRNGLNAWINTNSYDYPSPKRALIADGGFREYGDFVKALCFADLCMTGKFFSETYEANNCGRYRGSSTLKARHIEGVQRRVYAKMPVSQLFEEAHDAIRSGCSYVNAHNLSELQSFRDFVVVSSQEASKDRDK